MFTLHAVSSRRLRGLVLFGSALLLAAPLVTSAGCASVASQGGSGGGPGGGSPGGTGGFDTTPPGGPGGAPAVGPSSDNESSSSSGSSSSSSTSQPAPDAGSGCSSSNTSTVTVDMTSNGASMYITLSVDGGPSSSLLFDTGSVGMRIGEWNLPAKDQCEIVDGELQNPSSETFVNGMTYLGCWKKGDVTVGGVTFHDVDFTAIHEVTCSKGNPDCPASHCLPGGKGTGSWCRTPGTVGASLASGGGVDEQSQSLGNNLGSPFGYNLTNLGNGLIITTGGEGSNHGPQAPKLTLGLTAENRQGFHYYQLPQSYELASGKRGWIMNEIPICVEIGGLMATRCSSPTSGAHDQGVADTGMSTPQYWFDSDGEKTFARLLQSNGDVVAGTNVKITLPDGLVWSWETQNDDMHHEIQTHDSGGASGAFNLGLGFFFDFDVLLDPCKGQIGFRQRD